MFDDATVKAILAEREICAKICDAIAERFSKYAEDGIAGERAATEAAASIRARSEPRAQGVPGFSIGQYRALTGYIWLYSETMGETVLARGMRDIGITASREAVLASLSAAGWNYDEATGKLSQDNERDVLCQECGRDRGNREPHKPGCSQG